MSLPWEYLNKRSKSAEMLLMPGLMLLLARLLPRLLLAGASAAGTTSRPGTCAFSNRTSGAFTLPAPGFELSRMISLGAGDVMSLSGGPALRELRAPSGDPGYDEPRRHFLVAAGAVLPPPPRRP